MGAAALSSSWPCQRRKTPWLTVVALALCCSLVAVVGLDQAWLLLPSAEASSRLLGRRNTTSPRPSYEAFPRPGDAFRFLPCTNLTVPPPLDDPNPEQSWSALLEPDPQRWNWGSPPPPLAEAGPNKTKADNNPFAGRGIYLCGYLDVPLDYSNKSDKRIARLAVTKYQVAGVAWDGDRSQPRAGGKSERTIIVQPGGPGGSGTSMAWTLSEVISQRYSRGLYDVLGWDPRGVNASQPSISCFPYDADRDRWSQRSSLYLLESPSPRLQLEFVDAFTDASYYSCWKKYGDVPRFLTTALVARDLDQIRAGLGEEDVTGYFASYGTAIGQTFANMFPDRVGRLILDGIASVRDYRRLAGFSLSTLDNTTDAWHDGFLGECVDAGPEKCALAKPVNGRAVTVDDLERRMRHLLVSMSRRPFVGWTESNGPDLVTYSVFLLSIITALYNARTWPMLAQTLSELEAGNSSLALGMVSRLSWEYDPSLGLMPRKTPSSDELGQMVVCSEAYDAPQPAEGIAWWERLWANMTRDSWVAGDARFYSVFTCRLWTRYWPQPGEVYRGDLNHTLRTPMLLIGETYDPATPLRNARALLQEMGPQNGRLVVHHGYGHTSRDISNCTEAIAQAYIMHGQLPDKPETDCYANEKPYRYQTVALL